MNDRNRSVEFAAVAMLTAGIPFSETQGWRLMFIKRDYQKGYVTGVLLPEEVMNKAEYKAMRQAFDSLPLAKQGEAVRQIVAAWSLAYQDFPVNLKKRYGASY